MTRSLAHIEKIVDIQPIKGADRIEVATVLGWKCVVEKGKFKVGELVVYVEVDSIMPDKPEFEFLRSRKFRIRTIKLKGQISQGLVLPTSDRPNKSIPFGKSGLLGQDVTSLLGITKYLSPSERNEIRRQKQKAGKIKKFMLRYSWFRRLFMSRNQKARFPFWVSKTDEERIQNIPHVLEDFKDYKCTVTEKIDYQSATFTSQIVPKYNGLLGRLLPLKKILFVVASRNLTVTDKSTLYWKIAKKYNLEAICKTYPGIIIQGEQGDGSVQGNKYKIKEPKIWIFNVIKDGRFLDYAEMNLFCMANGLPIVPYLGTCKLSNFKSVEDMLSFAEGKSIVNSDIEREGIVIRYIADGKKQLSFKCVSNKFLLKHDH